MADEYQKSHGYNTTNVNENESSVGDYDKQDEIKDRGLFDFLGKKKETSEEECKPVEHVEYKPEHHHHKVDDYDQEPVVKVTSEVEQLHVSEPYGEVKEEEKKSSLFEKLHHRSKSSSSSSSDEEEEVIEGGEIIKKKKKKSLKEKIEEKFHGDHDKEEELKKYDDVDTSIPIEKYEEPIVHHHEEPIVHHTPIIPTPTTHNEPEVCHEEKKGFLEKIKEKLPGGHKKAEEVETVQSTTTYPVEPVINVNAYETHHEPEVKEEKKGFLEKIKEKLHGTPKNEEDHKEKDKETPAPSHY